MTTHWIVLPLLIPLLTGCSALIRKRPLRRYVVLTGVILNLWVCLLLLLVTANGDLLVAQMGGHPAPYGITLVVDPLSAIMLAITAITSFVVMLFSMVTIDANRERFAYYPLLAFLILGINFAFLTGDLFTLYVAFEIMLMASFVLLTLGGERGQIEGGIKYVTLNLISSTVFLIAAGLTYSVAGTLNIAQLVERLSGQSSPGITTILAGLFLIAFGVKAAVFPLFFWLPASYHTPPIAVTALFGGLLTKVGIYALWRVVGMIFPHDLMFLQPFILVIGGLTMVTGVLGAVAQIDFRRLLSFHIISQIGYLIMGIGLFTPLALTGAIFFTVHVIIAKTALFLISGIVYEMHDSYNLKKLGGLQKINPGVAALFFVAALGLAGLPPLSGFWAKLILVRAGIESAQYLITAVALMVSILTLYSMIKIWHEVFWKAVPDKQDKDIVVKTDKKRVMMLSAGILTTLVILIGIFAEPLYQISENAASILTTPSTYVQSVLLTEETPQ